ncbi:hypothetical protein BDZ89DRAFT_1045007 [Hymenopellis radicata]|nr:hypothetical protein BDZ89DRAFT_1045007 [Hymenopellis radicata]
MARQPLSRWFVAEDGGKPQEEPTSDTSKSKVNANAVTDLEIDRKMDTGFHQRKSIRQHSARSGQHAREVPALRWLKSEGHDLRQAVPYAGGLGPDDCARLNNWFSVRRGPWCYSSSRIANAGRFVKRWCRLERSAAACQMDDYHGKTIQGQTRLAPVWTGKQFHSWKIACSPSLKWRASQETGNGVWMFVLLKVAGRPTTRPGPKFETNSAKRPAETQDAYAEVYSGEIRGSLMLALVGTEAPHCAFQSSDKDDANATFRRAMTEIMIVRDKVGGRTCPDVGEGTSRRNQAYPGPSGNPSERLAVTLKGVAGGGAFQKDEEDVEVDGLPELQLYEATRLREALFDCISGDVKYETLEVRRMCEENTRQVGNLHGESISIELCRVDDGKIEVQVEFSATRKDGESCDYQVGDEMTVYKMAG